VADYRLVTETQASRDRDMVKRALDDVGSGEGAAPKPLEIPGTPKGANAIKPATGSAVPGACPHGRRPQ